MSKNKQDLWDLMYPNAEQLLKEALEKTDEEVAESLRAKGYDLDVLDQQLVGLVKRLPPYKAPAKKKGFIAVKAASAMSALGATGYGIYAYMAATAATAAPVVGAAAMTFATAAAAPPAPTETVAQPVVASVGVDAGKEGGGR